MKYYSDGFVIGSNPSQIGGGYTVVDENNNLIKHERVEKIGFTNNEGEILGILEAVRMCEKGDSVSTDSMCCLAWCRRGKSKVRSDLNPIFQEIKKLVEEKKINFMWEGRNFNLSGIYNETRPRNLLKSERIFTPDDSLP